MLHGCGVWAGFWPVWAGSERGRLEFRYTAGNQNKAGSVLNFRLWAGYPPCPRTSGICRQSEQSALESELFPQAWSIIRQQVQRIEVGFWRGLYAVAAWVRAGSRLI